MSPPVASITRRELYTLVWREPVSRVAPRFGMSDRGLKKVCDRHSIPTPPHGHWPKKAAGQKLGRIPLPTQADPAKEVITFSASKRVKYSVSKVASRVEDESIRALIQAEGNPDNHIDLRPNDEPLHPLVAAAHAAMQKQKPDDDEMIRPRCKGRQRLLDIRVTQALIPRAIRLMDAFVKGFLQRGYQIGGESPTAPNRLAFSIGAEVFAFDLRERYTVIPFPNPAGLPRYRTTETSHQPTGHLEFRIDEKSICRDRVRVKPEDRLNMVMVQFYVALDERKRRQRDAVESERRHDVRCQIRELLAKQRQLTAELGKRDAQERESLRDIAKDREEARRLRDFAADYLATAEQRHGPLALGSETHQWVEWLLGKADTIDPFASGFDDLPTDVLARRRELEGQLAELAARLGMIAETDPQLVEEVAAEPFHVPQTWRLGQR